MKRTDEIERLETGLRRGRRLGKPQTITYGPAPYDVYPVVPRIRARHSSTVWWDIPVGTEWMHVLGPLRMKMRAVSGEGEVGVWSPDGSFRVMEVSERRRGRMSQTATIRQGDTYAMHGDVVVEDVARPPFLPEHEVSLKEVTQAETTLVNGMRIVVCNPRHLGGAAAAGVLLLTIGEEHDTIQENLAHADQSKFYSTPPHCHAKARRVGQDTEWPVSVRIVGQQLDIVHRHEESRRLGRMVLAQVERPTFVVQPDALIWQVIDQPMVA